MIEHVELHGLREFRAGLRAMDRTLPKQIRVAGNKAAKIVVDAARPRVPVGPSVGGHAASSIKAASSNKAVRVSEGGARFSYMPWLDFGGTIRPRPNADGTRQEIRRPYLRKGRYVWAAFADHREAVQDAYLDGLHDAARDAGLNPRRY